MSGAAVERGGAGLVVLVFALVFGARAAAQPLEQERARGYYRAHIGLTLAAAGVGTAFTLLLAPHSAGFEPFPNFGPDVSVRRNFSPSAAALSDRLLGFNVVFPFAAQLSDGFDIRFANAALVYAEAQATSLMLTSITKVSVRRPRPYTHNGSRLAQAFEREQGSEAFVSFFSGHSSGTYTAAMAGSILYALRTRDLPARHVMWGLEFGSAALTAQLRVRAGRHYRTDVWVGSLVGAGIGLAVPALHGLPLSRVRASEWATGAGSAVAVVALTELADVCSTLGLCRAMDEPAVDPSHVSPAGASLGPARRLRWSLAPLPAAGGPGLLIAAEW